MSNRFCVSLCQTDRVFGDFIFHEWFFFDWKIAGEIFCNRTSHRSDGSQIKRILCVWSTGRPVERPTIKRISVKTTVVIQTRIFHRQHNYFLCLVLDVNLFVRFKILSFRLSRLFVNIDRQIGLCSVVSGLYVVDCQFVVSQEF